MSNGNDNRLLTYYYSGQVPCAMKNKLSGHIISLSVYIIYFQCHYDSFYQLFEEIYIFAVTMDPFQTFLAPCNLNTSC